MKKLIITTIITGLMLISCSKENTLEPGTNNPPVIDTTVTPAQDSVISQISSLFAYRKIHHYVFAGDTIAGRRNIKVDSLRVPVYVDSVHFTYEFCKNGDWTNISSSGNMGMVLQKIVWKKF